MFPDLNFRALLYGVPGDCALCGRILDKLDRKRGVCSLCKRELQAEMSWVCKGCGLPLTPPLRLCPTCRNSPYHFVAAASAGLYKGELKRALDRFDRGDRWLCHPLGELLADAAAPLAPFQIIVPVPSQGAFDLAGKMSEITGIPVLRRLNRKGIAQKRSIFRKSKWERVESPVLEGNGKGIEGASVLIVDEVMGTGMTLHEAAGALLDAGAARVLAATVARSVRKRGW